MTTISICASVKFADEIVFYKERLESMGYKCLYPVLTEAEKNRSYESYKDKIKGNYINKHYKKIQVSDAVLILNIDKNNIKGYIGGNTLMELGFAHTKNKDIFLLNEVPDMSYTEEIKSFQPVILNGDLSKIDIHFNNLPKVYLASESELKLRSVSKSLRDLNLRYQIKGVATESKVSEQPSSIKETLSGANNRLDDIKLKVKDNYQYLVAIESGIVKFDEFENYIGCVACVVENDKGQREISFTTDMFFPKEFTDLVPSKYPDLGVLVQKEYGAIEKDPYLYISNNKIDRMDTLDLAVKAAIAKF